MFVPKSILNGPVTDKRILTIPQRTMTDMKLGIYRTSCIFCLILLLAILLSRSASIIGIGNPHNRPKILSLSVFARYCIKSGDDKNCSKYLSPTHSLPNIPLNGLYFWKAIRMPPIGMYLNTIVSNSAGPRKNTYSCQCCLTYTRVLCIELSFTFVFM